MTHRKHVRASSLYDDDVRPSDIVMSLGGCWLLLGVIVAMMISG